jgi:hypothetical protein
MAEQMIEEEYAEYNTIPEVIRISTLEKFSWTATILEDEEDWTDEG